MTTGLPVVASKIRGNTDIVEDGVNGYLVGCHDVDGFADGIQNIIASDDVNMNKTNILKMKCFSISAVNEVARNIYEGLRFC